MSQLCLSSSTQMQRRPSCLAAKAVVPDPQNGSRITPPVGVDTSVRRYFIKSSGLTVGWSLPGPLSFFDAFEQ